MALQMTWQPTSLHLLHDRLKTIGAASASASASAPSPPLGLKNLGNTCYLNSVLQCLTYTPPLANFCLNNQHTSLCDRNPNPKNNNCPFCILERRIVRSLTLDATLDAPSKIHSCLTIFADHFRYGRQEDAHEFLRYVIDACHNTCLRLKKLHYTTANGTATATGAGGDSTIVKEIFGGALRSQVKCLSCGADSNKTDEIMDISLDLFHSTSLKDAMDRFFDAEVLDGANKYKCEKCKKLVVARKQMSILKAPNILVIQLKRFEGMHGGKIDRAVSFEEVLLLSGYMCKESQDPHPEYNLFGTIVHSGYSPESGHYYAYIKDAIGRWYCCNDSHVSLSTLHEVLSEKVYILFFSRNNERSRPTKAASCANGVKSIHRNGNDGAPTSEAVMPLKSVARRPSEAHTEKVIPSISRNGKVPSSPLIKFGLVKTLDSKRVYGNGNGNGNGNGHALTNGHVKKHFDKNESSDMEKNRNKRALVTSNNVANGYTSHDSGEQRSKQKVLSHANGEIHSVVKLNTMEKEVFANNGLGSSSIVKGIETDPVSNGREEKYISGCKRKTLDQEPNNLLQDEHQIIFEKSKEMIMKDASSSLRSSGWYEDVYCFMREKKRLRAQATGNTTSEIELKKKMIEEAKQAFSSQIPQSLKAHLIGSLRSLFQP